MAAQVVRLVGGPGNVADVTHCFLRLRLTLVDPAAADRDALRALPAVVVLVDQDGQLQLALRRDLYAVHDAVRGIVDRAVSP
ncbi:MAG TPA: PTS transporter subunit EIIB [Cellulomonas sp.]